MKNSYKFWMSNCKKSFSTIKNWSEKYPTWNDVQKSNEQSKSSVWRAIKNFRKSTNNDKAYKFIKTNEGIYCYGWLTLTGKFSLVFDYVNRR